MTHDDVQKWINKYVGAWRSRGTSQLANIFSDNVSYGLSPWKRPLLGLTSVEKFWEQARSGPDEKFTLHSEIVAVENKTAVARVEVHYAEDTPARWRDLWVITFDEDGLCEHFEEWPFTSGQDDGQSI